MKRRVIDQGFSLRGWLVGTCLALAVTFGLGSLGPGSLGPGSLGLGSLGLGSLGPGSLWAADVALHERVDRLIESDHVGTPAPLAGDSAFLRRIYLDLVGRAPGIAETRAFLADESPDKRRQLVDRLLESPEFARHLANVLDVMLMERRGDKHVKSPEWQSYLLESARQNKPFDQLAREILAADGVDPKLRPAVKFYLDRDGEVNLLTRDVGRVFFGMDVQCAQCHNHPLIDDYLQSDYYGIYAFLNRSFVFTDAKAKTSYFAEKAEGEVTYKSVFTEESGSTGPRLPGDEMIDEPAFAKGDEYLVKPEKDVRPVPKYSRRARLAELATSGENQAFNRNLANRLWAHMLGRGLVHPVDLHHSDNPPTHPELLQLLADEIVALKFDLKAFLREIALTRTYQRGFDMPENLASQAETARQQLAALEAAVQQCKGQADVAKEEYLAAQLARGEAKKALDALQPEFDKASAEHAAAQTEHKTGADKLAQLKSQQDAAVELHAALKQVADHAQQAAQRIEVPELSPILKTLQERLAKLDAERQTAATELARQQPLVEAAQAKLEQARRQLETLQPGYESARVALKQRNDELRAARLRSDRAAAAVTLAERRVEQAGQLIANHQQLVSVESARGRLETTAGQVQQAMKQVADWKTRLEAEQTRLAQAESQRDATAQTLADRRSACEQSESALELVADVTAKTSRAAGQLPEETQLASVRQQLETRLEQLRGEAAESRRQVTSLQAELDAQTETMTSLKRTVDETRQALAAADRQLQEARAQWEQAESEVAAAAGRQDELLGQLVDDWTRRFTVAVLEPLSPEQLAWSAMEVTGTTDRYRAAAEAELNKKQPLPEAADAEQRKARDVAIEAEVHAKLAGQVAAFVNLFGAGAGQPQGEFFATVDQALFLANGTQVRGWLSPSAGNLTDRLARLETPPQVAEELYLSVLARRPTELEVQEVARQLAARPEQKPAVVQDLAWGLLTSAEFRFSH